MKSQPAALQQRAMAVGVVGRVAGRPVVRRDAHAHRPVRPGGAHGGGTPPAGNGSGFQAAAVVVGALVGQRADEARQQVAVRAVQLQPVEASRGAAARGGDERFAPWRPCRRASCGGHLVLRAIGHRAEGRPAASCRAIPAAAVRPSASQPSCVDPLGPLWPSCMPIALALAVHESRR